MDFDDPNQPEQEPAAPSGRARAGPLALYLIGAGAILLIALLAFAY